LDFSFQKIRLVGNAGLASLAGRVSGDEPLRDVVEILADDLFMSATITIGLKGRKASKE